jgi:hypothetical protein
MKAMQGRIGLLKHLRAKPTGQLVCYIIAKSSAGLIASPNHGDRSREAAAHVEREEPLRILDLASAGLFCELLIRFKNLANACRPHRVTIGD